MRSIFVFGSNLAGRHGRGSALEAMRKWGAEYGVGEGPTGYAYALPTKTKHLATMSLHDIEHHVKKFLDYARRFPEIDFQVVSIGCGLAGYKPKQIAPMFKGHPSNVHLTKEFEQVLETKI